GEDGEARGGAERGDGAKGTEGRRDVLDAVQAPDEEETRGVRLLREWLREGLRRDAERHARGLDTVGARGGDHRRARRRHARRPLQSSRRLDSLAEMELSAVRDVV